MPPNAARRLAVLAVVALHLAACHKATRTKIVLLFADASSSIHDRTRFHEAWAAVTDTTALGAGDRLVVARIDGATYDGFRPALDLELPAVNPYVDNPIVAREAATAARRRLDGVLDSVLAGPPSQRTDVLSSLDIAGKVLAADSARRRRIVILSDMIQEDGHGLDFAHTSVSDQLTDSLIGSRRQAGRLPDLRGDTVIVVGATDRPDVQRFWLRYVAAAGGTLRAVDYSPALVNYRP